MSRSIAGASTRLHTTALFVAGMLAFVVAGASQAAPDATDGVRTSISRHIAKGGRDNPTPTSESASPPGG